MVSPEDNIEVVDQLQMHIQFAIQNLVKRGNRVNDCLLSFNSVVTKECGVFFSRGHGESVSTKTVAIWSCGQ